MQIIDKTHALMHWQKHKRGAHHGDISKDKREKIPTAIIIGGEPATSIFFNCSSSRRIGQILVCRNNKKRRNQNGKM